MSRNLIICLLAACATAACAPALSSVPLAADAADIALLAGEWEGEYASSESGRGGSIIFRLAAGDDVARGDVLMVPRDAMAGASADDSAPPAALEARRAPQLLTITFVRIADGRVSGTLDPYTDPECDCTLTTTFVGTHRGEVIEGTFTSRGSAERPPQSGNWRVQRKARP